MKYTRSRMLLPTLSLALVSVLAGCVSTPAPQKPRPAAPSARQTSLPAPPHSLIDVYNNKAISLNECRSQGRIAEVLNGGRYSGYCIEND